MAAASSAGISRFGTGGRRKSVSSSTPSERARASRRRAGAAATTRNARVGAQRPQLGRDVGQPLDAVDGAERAGVDDERRPARGRARRGSASPASPPARRTPPVAGVRDHGDRGDRGMPRATSRPPCRATGRSRGRTRGTRPTRRRGRPRSARVAQRADRDRHLGPQVAHLEHHRRPPGEARDDARQRDRERRRLREHDVGRQAAASYDARARTARTPIRARYPISFAYARGSRSAGCRRPMSHDAASSQEAGQLRVRRDDRHLVPARDEPPGEPEGARPRRIRRGWRRTGGGTQPHGRKANWAAAARRGSCGPAAHRLS